MKNLNGLIRPLTFLEAGEYIWYEKNRNATVMELKPVIFMNYDPCPAFLIVKDGKQRIRCPREDVYLIFNK